MFFSDGCRKRFWREVTAHEEELRLSVAPVGLISFKGLAASTRDQRKRWERRFKFQLVKSNGAMEVLHQLIAIEDRAKELDDA